MTIPKTCCIPGCHSDDRCTSEQMSFSLPRDHNEMNEWEHAVSWQAPVGLTCDVEHVRVWMLEWFLCHQWHFYCRLHSELRKMSVLFILQLASFFRLWPVYSVLWIFFLFAVVRLLKKLFFLFLLTAFFIYISVLSFCFSVACCIHLLTLHRVFLR